MTSYSSLPVVRIHVSFTGPDDPLMAKLHKFIAEHELFPIRGFGYADGRNLIQFYLPDDARRVKAFLDAEGAKQTNKN